MAKSKIGYWRWLVRGAAWLSIEVGKWLISIPRRARAIEPEGEFYAGLLLGICFASWITFSSMIPSPFNLIAMGMHASLIFFAITHGLYRMDTEDC